MKLLFTVLLSIYFTTGFCQNKEISFQGYSHSKKKGFQVTVSEKDDFLKVEFLKLDTISNQINNDKNYKRNSTKIRKLTKSKNPSPRLIEQLAIEYIELRNKYTFQKKDIIILNRNQYQSYNDSFLQIFKTPIDVLKKQKKTRIVLDGKLISTILKNKNRKLLINLNSPNETSNPILISFLKETLNLYRIQNIDNNSNSEYTLGY